MLRTGQISRIRNGIKKAHDLLAGDTITHVNFANGTETELTCIFQNLDQQSFKGLQIDSSGVVDYKIYEVQFENSYLTTEGVSISEQDHVVFEGRQLDFIKSEELKQYIVPICGIHNLTVCRLEDSVRINDTYVPEPVDQAIPEVWNID